MSCPCAIAKNAWVSPRTKNINCGGSSKDTARLFGRLPARTVKLLPTIFELYGYKVFFCANENNEPVHVHVAKGKQSADATKIWLPPESNPVLAHNNSRIPQKDLTRLMKAIAHNRDTIIARWYDYFGR
ncbi:MAG: DUF4160 domain-containing protein [Selenomonadaceae bacterium]|nr:DUF4160 domain-containing protein [Selenomonadaceae bacterium]